MNNVEKFEQVKSVVLEGYGTYDKIKVNILVYLNISINVVYKNLIKLSCCLINIARLLIGNVNWSFSVLIL